VHTPDVCAAIAVVASAVTMARSVCIIALMVLASLAVASAQCIECKVSRVSQQQRWLVCGAIAQ
jgi:hypothetical protein